MSSFLYIIKIFIISYIAFLSILYLIQRKLIYFPLKTSPSLGTFSKVYTKIQTQTKDKLLLTHWLAKQDEPYIVILHGNAGHIESRAYKFQFLVNQGYSVLLIEYRGYGDNPGWPTEQSLIDDSVLALEWLFKHQRISAKDIILFGESLGSGVAIALATQYQVKGLIFDGAFSSVVEVGKSAYPFLPIRWLLKDTWDSESRIHKVHAPTLFIHAKKDSIIPFHLAEKLFQAANKPKQHIWLENSDHNNNLEIESVRKSIIDFIQSLSHH